MEPAGLATVPATATLTLPPFTPAAAGSYFVCFNSVDGSDTWVRSDPFGTAGPISYTVSSPVAGVATVVTVTGISLSGPPTDDLRLSTTAGCAAGGTPPTTFLAAPTVAGSGTKVTLTGQLMTGYSLHRLIFTQTAGRTGPGPGAYAHVGCSSKFSA